MDLCKAIENRNIISFNYDGLDRIVKPAAYGKRLSTGNDLLRAYQFGGSSKSEIPHWKLFKVNGMSNIEVSDKKFSENPPDYKRGDKTMDSIYCEL